MMLRMFLFSLISCVYLYLIVFHVLLLPHEVNGDKKYIFSSD